MLIECKGNNKKWNMQIFGMKNGIFVKKDQKWSKKDKKKKTRKKIRGAGTSRIIKEKNDLPLLMFYHNATRPIEGISKETC